VRLELPVDEGEIDRYESARSCLGHWLDKGVLVRDDQPAFYVYRMGYHDEQGRARQTAGVVGALELAVPGEGGVLPHERTMSKPKDDRLNLLRACRANLSPVWGLSLAEGLSSLCELPGPPDGRATDDDGVHHRLWRITQPGVLDAIAEAVASSPVVIADGHHRYETALAYQDERRREKGGAGDFDLLMAYVVELSDEQLTVRPIHRLLVSLPAGTDVLERLSPWFEAFAAEADPSRLTAAMTDAGALGLVVGTGAWLLRPRPGAFAGTPADADDATDSRLLEVALEGIDAELAFHHDPATVVAAVTAGEAAGAVLLRAPTVAQIAAAAHARRRMPEKSTFFHPKPRTGMVFRPVLD
jgi:uncharacterized protein (DUF1015 family)